jgi:hypothetical protein
MPWTGFACSADLGSLIRNNFSPSSSTKAIPGVHPEISLGWPPLVMTLKAAKALGLTIPESFLLRGDQVIEQSR